MEHFLHCLIFPISRDRETIATAELGIFNHLGSLW